MTQTTQELLADIQAETKLNLLTQGNKVIHLFNDTFKIWNVINNKHSDCITIKALKKGNRKTQTYVLNGNGQLLLDGKKEIATMPYDVNYNHIGSIQFNDYLEA